MLAVLEVGADSTRNDFAGVYLIVGAATNAYPTLVDVAVLTNTLRLIYTLTELNGYLPLGR